MAEVPLKSLERYDVLDRIAVGGMAEVFLAKAYGAHGFEKTLAIKRILPELARDPEFEDRFIAEAKVAVKLSHANVVQVFDFGRFAGSLFIAMEYVDGLDLAALLRRHRDSGRVLPVAAAFHIAVELARGIDFAHQHGVVHRDVSPSNILLSRAGEVKIADFGIAVAARPEKPKPGAKRKVMGKWRYMSPEQARGEPLDPRSDIFSMAVVMYELFTGEKLFPGDEVEDIVRNINEMPLPRPSEVRPDLPKRVDEILMPALARDPSRRPLRAAVLQRAVTELSYESSIVATALDVADAVAIAMEVPSSGGGSASGRHTLDAIIRAQIAENLGKDPTNRRTSLTTDQKSTAITASKLMRDRDAPLVITREAILLSGTQAPSEVEEDANEEGAGRITEPVQLQTLGDETTSRAVLGRRVDPDGITHLELETSSLGAPPPVKAEASRPPSMPAPPGLAAAASVVPARRRAWLVAVLAVVFAGGAGRWYVAGRGDRAAATATDAAPGLATGDAAVTGAATAVLEIETSPKGASGQVVAGETTIPVPATPTRVDVPAGVPLSVRLDHAGYRTWTDEGLRAEPNQVVRILATLVAARAELHVETDPPGASVTLGGRLIGETPLDRNDHDVARGVSLVIARSGYESVHRRIDLTVDRPARVREALVAIQRFGKIDLYIDDGWAEVYLKGKKLGRATRGMVLPVGRHRLRLVNPPSHKETWLDVVVTEGETTYYRTRFP